MAQSALDVVVVGSCNTDFLSYAPHLPKEGETLTGSKFETGCGGKGANQCVAAGKLGAKTAMITKIGDDIFGLEFLKSFKANNVKCDHIGVVKGVSTGVAAISVADNGANCIIIVPGANNSLTTEDVEAAEETIKSSKVLVCQNEISLDVTLAALKLARKQTVKCIFNPAPAQAGLHSDFFTIPDIFCVNETEAEIMTGSVVNSVESAIAACKILVENKNCRSVVITLGSNGCVYQAKKGDEPMHIGTDKVFAVDTTGAGDSFIGSLAFFMCKFPHLSMAEMLKRANKIAARSVTKRGTQVSFPTASELPADLYDDNDDDDDDSGDFEKDDDDDDDDESSEDDGFDDEEDDENYYDDEGGNGDDDEDSDDDGNDENYDDYDKDEGSGDDDTDEDDNRENDDDEGSEDYGDDDEENNENDDDEDSDDNNYDDYDKDEGCGDDDVDEDDNRENDVDEDEYDDDDDG
ncbi:ribokinase [Plakobranchus ocellatus]|uniref:Ribokinase n=1 Tax=Plakobranchus ocellatus TaxID=259542 RepID=A0AAV3ZWR9_9GAST|nr:ribokinase [Plakobranchus ocellatus]